MTTFSVIDRDGQITESEAQLCFEIGVRAYQRFKAHQGRSLFVPSGVKNRPTEDIIMVSPKPARDAISVSPQPPDDFVSVSPKPARDAISVSPQPPDNFVSVSPKPQETLDYAKIKELLEGNKSTMNDGLQQVIVSQNSEIAALKKSLEMAQKVSIKKGAAAEKGIRERLNEIFPSLDITESPKHAGDITIDAGGVKVMVEVKHYERNLPTEEVAKFERDLEGFAAGVLIALDHGIVGVTGVKFSMSNGRPFFLLGQMTVDHPFIKIAIEFVISVAKHFKGAPPNDFVAKVNGITTQLAVLDEVRRTLKLMLDYNKKRLTESMDGLEGLQNALRELLEGLK